MLIRSLLLVLFLASPATAQTVFVPFCVGTDDTARFTALITTIGANNATIQLPYKAGTRCAVSNLTIPANITLSNANGTGIKVNTGQTLTVVGPVVGPPRQFFYNATAGLGTVSFAGNKLLRELHPEWWGTITNTADATVMNACTTAADTLASATIVIGNNTYGLESTWNLGSANAAQHRISVRGVSPVNSILSWTGSTSGTAIKTFTEKYVRFENFLLDNSVAKGTTVGMLLGSSGGTGTQTGQLIVSHVIVDGFDIGVQVGDTGSVASSENLFSHLTVQNNNTGVKLIDFNTLNNKFEMFLGASNTNYALDAHSAPAYIDGGSMAGNGIADFFFQPNGLNFTVKHIRTEMAGANSMFIRGSNNLNLTVEGCSITNTTSFSGPVIVARGNITLTGNQFYYSNNATIVPFGDNPTTGDRVNGPTTTLVMTGNSVDENSKLFNIDPTNGSINGMRYVLYGNQKWRNGLPTGVDWPNRSGRVVWPNEVDDEIRGTATLVAGTATVTITTRENANYDVFVESSAAEALSVTGKTTTQFVITSSNGSSTAVVSYVIRRQ